MLCITVRFPLGIYHAQSAQSQAEPEWPPSPLRLVGALLAAAHGRHGGDPSDDRALIARLCESSPPIIAAPLASPVGKATDGEATFLRGVTRWAPRNYFGTKGRTQAPVEKVGTAVGASPVHFIWPDLQLERGDLDRLSALASDTTFIGTSRSPVIASVRTEVPGDGLTHWEPASTADRDRDVVEVRVPNRTTIQALDARQEARRSSEPRVETAGMVPGLWMGDEVPYILPGSELTEVIEPRWWGELIVLSVDTDRSEVIPKTAAAYLLARATRVALLGAFEDAGRPDEAPPILRARGGDPHCAFVPLADVWHRHSSGRILGVAVVLPSDQRVPDVGEQRARIEAGLAELVGSDDSDSGRYIRIPNAGRVHLSLPTAAAASRFTLRPATYAGPTRSWITATPIVHSRWKKRRGGLREQVELECSYVGLPTPECVEAIRGPALPAAANRPVAVRHVPEAWRRSLDGPTSHLRITFGSPVAGPVLLGRARHFGLGLCVPESTRATRSRPRMVEP